MTKNYPSYRKDLIARARKLRKNSTPGEIELWKLVKNKRVLGYQFRRQRPINNYIVDFYCKELRLAIEIDGSSHDHKVEYDQKRQSIIEELGISFLRFSEEDTKENADFVVKEIENWIITSKQKKTPSPQSPPAEGKLFKQTKDLDNKSSSSRERKQRRDSNG